MPKKLTEKKFIAHFNCVPLDDRELLEHASEIKDGRGGLVAQEALRALKFFDEWLESIGFERG
jgi:hypothetical protein